MPTSPTPIPTRATSRYGPRREASGADAFIDALPDGYDTVVGERGLTLSGGQRQRIALARAILTDPRILVLDDATSSVDAATEEAIHDTLRELMADRTTILIAHRRSTLRLAQRIVVIDKGRVVDAGSHDDLLDAQRAIPRVAHRTRRQTASLDESFDQGIREVPRRAAAMARSTTERHRRRGSHPSVTARWLERMSPQLLASVPVPVGPGGHGGCLGRHTGPVRSARPPTGRRMTSPRSMSRGRGRAPDGPSGSCASFVRGRAGSRSGSSSSRSTACSRSSGRSS